VGSLLAIVVPLALGAAVSPTLFALEVLVLTGKRHPIARGWAVASGAGAVLVAFGLLGVTLLRTVDTGHRHRSPTGAAIDLGAAALLALLAARSAHKAKTAAEAHHEHTKGRLADAPTLAFVGVGALGMLVNFSTLVLFLPAVREIEHSSVDVAEKVVVWLIITVITLLPVLLPLTLVALLGTRADPLLARLSAFVGRHARTITIAIELLFAVILAWKGIGDLR